MVDIFQIIEEDKCTGCQACAQICPQNVIMMRYKDDGFLYPVIDENNCVDCKLCIKVCPTNKEKNITEVKRLFSGCAIDKQIVLNSSSGGIFKLLSDYVINKGGIVFGAMFNSETKEVKHSSTDEVKLEQLMRSKYVQSNINGVFVQVGIELIKERMILFCGTPCQIRGLKSYLCQKKITGQLITVDFMCHGVPSPGLYKKFLTDIEQKKNSQITNMTFREKEFGWRSLVSKIYFQDGDVWIQKQGDVSFYYYYYFLHNYILRDSCYTCSEYKEHVSDLTLADDWFSGKAKDDKGTSLIFVNTNAGENILENIEDRLKLEDISKAFTNQDIYSHKNYDYEKKKKWILAYKLKGFSYVSKQFYRKIYRKNRFHQLIQRNIIKDVIKKIF